MEGGDAALMPALDIVPPEAMQNRRKASFK
jgi:hypothetical protein